MTQLQSVQAMSDEQLNAELATGLMGWKHIYCGVGEYFHESGILLRSHVRPYSSDPAHSLEIQAKAIEVDKGSYINKLSGLLGWEDGSSNVCLLCICDLLQATPRQRSEAAYLTIKDQP